MRRFDEFLARNRRMAEGFAPVEGEVAFDLVILTWVDPRVDPAHILHVHLGEAFVMRVVGGRVTGSVVDGLLAIDAITHRPMAVMVIHHTDCATAHFAAAQPDWPLGLDGSVLAAKAVVDPWATVAADVDLLRVRLPEGSLVRGYVYDVETGLVGAGEPADG
ncbi:MAG: carbonic anhydrase [Acidimicrobiia bacterium]